MPMEEYPSNSKKAHANGERPQMEKVVHSDVSVKKPGFGDKMKQVFGGSSMKRGAAIVVGTVVIPAILDMSKDAIHTWIDGMFAGGDFDNVRRRGGTGSYRGPNGQRFTDYSASSLSRKYESSRIGARPEISRRARERQDFRGEIVLESRAEGDIILDKLAWLIRDYDHATVKDMLELAGITATFTDDKWGWYDLSGARVEHYGGQYLLRMPPTEAID